MAMPFLKAVTTDEGIKLLNRAQSGEGAIAFTRMAIGNGIYNIAEKTEESLKRARNLKSLKNSYKLSATVKLDDNSVKTSAIISNQDLITKEAVITEGYNINEVGLFAKIAGDAKDILLSIAVTEGEQGDYIPAFTGNENAQVMQNFIVSISNGVKINLKYSDGAVAFKEDVDKQLSDFKTEVLSGLDKLNETFTKATKNIVDRVTRLENAVYNDITGNPWTLTFNDLEGINLTKGNYNKIKQRLEC